MFFFFDELINPNLPYMKPLPCFTAAIVVGVAFIKDLHQLWTRSINLINGSNSLFVYFFQPSVLVGEWLLVAGPLRASDVRGGPLPRVPSALRPQPAAAVGPDRTRGLPD